MPFYKKPHRDTIIANSSATLADLDVSAGTLTVDEVNKRIGCGTDTPSTQLQVEGTAPYLTLKNSTAENTQGGCESRIIFEDHSNTALGQIEVSHSGGADDTKGKLILSTHNGSALTAAITVNENQSVTVAGDLTVNGTTTRIGRGRFCGGGRRGYFCRRGQRFDFVRRYRYTMGNKQTAGG